MENEIKIECAYTELVDIDKLIPHPKNSNSHPVEQVEDLKKAILFSGIRRPIVVSTLSGFIISGHCEYESLKQLGVKKVPVDYQNFKDDLHERIDMAAHNLLARQSKLVTVNLQELALELDQNNLSCALAGIPENKLEILATQPPVWFDDFQKDLNSKHDPSSNANMMSDWISDFDDAKKKIDSVEPNLDGIVSVIKITCPQNITDELKIYLKDELVSPRFAGVTIE